MNANISITNIVNVELQLWEDLMGDRSTVFNQANQANSAWSSLRG